MSYILDALKRADAERERGHVPGLHSQSAPALSPASAIVRRGRSTPVLMAGSAILLLALGGALWWWLSAPSGEPEPTTEVQPPAAAPAPTVAEPPAAILETPPAPAVPPPPALPILAPPPAAVPAAVVAPDAPAAVTGTVAGMPPTGPGPDIPGAVAATPPDMPSYAAPMPAPRTPMQQSGARGIASPPTPSSPNSASMPSVQVSGVTYSENRSHRMLIANGKVVHEGQEIEPGLTVEVIAPRSAVLNHRGSRYNINY